MRINNPESEIKGNVKLATKRKKVRLKSAERPKDSDDPPENVENVENCENCEHVGGVSQAREYLGAGERRPRCKMGRQRAKKKRVRTVMTNLQIKMLGNIFQENQFPSTEVREEIARSIHMSPRSVQIWFQNQRQKHKNDRVGPYYNWRGLDLLAEAAEIMWKREQESKERRLSEDSGRPPQI